MTASTVTAPTGHQTSTNLRCPRRALLGFDVPDKVRPDGSFQPAIARAMQTASNTGMDVTSHFLESQHMVKREQGGGRTREDFDLSRQAAYLVAMNGDPNKPEVAAAQIYFSETTEQAEIAAAGVAALPAWVQQQMATLVQVGRIEVEQQRQAEQLDRVDARVGAIEGAHDWYSALAYARLNGHVTETGFLRRVGAAAARMTRAEGLQPGTTQHPAYGTVGTYPEAILRRAFAETAVTT